MGDCRNRSEQITFAPLRPWVLGAAVVVPIPFIVDIDVEFSEPMQTALVPGNVNVELVTGSGPAWGTFQSWTDPTHARYQFAVAWPDPPVTIQLKVLDVNLKNLAGGICKVSDVIVLIP